MKQSYNTIDAIKFAKFCNDHPELWDMLPGARIRHSAFGYGIVEDIEDRDNNCPLIYVQFGNGHGCKRFNPEGFTCGAIDVIEISEEQNSDLQKWKRKYYADFSNTLSDFSIESLWHMTHRDNIKSICRLGLLSNRMAQKLKPPPTDISLSDVQRWRERKDPIYDRCLHDYVPLYINPRNPMLYLRKDNQDYICMVEVDPLILIRSPFLIADGNAASQASRFYSRLSDLEHLPWETLRGKTWNDDPDGKRRMCSEILIHPKIPIEFIRRIHCRSKKTLNYLRNYDKGSSLTPQLYF